MAARTVACLLTVAAILTGTGCSPRAARHPQAAHQASSTPRPRPTVTVTRSARLLVAGQTGGVDAQAGVRLRVGASRPAVSRARLSSSYGYPPAHGYYVTFMVTIVNTGTEPVGVAATDFRVRVAGQGNVTTNEGNAPYSGASAQLDTTQVDPGKTLRGPVTFDVRRPHGTLDYLPDGSAALRWRF